MFSYDLDIHSHFRQTISTLQDIIKDKSELVPDKPREKRDKMSSESRVNKKNRTLEVNNNNTSDDSETVQMKKLSKEFWTLNQASEVERQRLGELVTLLTTRLKLAEDKTTEAEANLREEKLKCARAEIAAERAQIDLRDSGKLTSSMSSRSDSGFRAKLVEDVEKMSVEDLRWEVVRLKEELRAKRRELGEARGGREEMVRIYKQMLEDTRQVYRQTLSDT